MSIIIVEQLMVVPVSHLMREGFMEVREKSRECRDVS